MELWRILLVGAIVVGVVALLLPMPEGVPGLEGGVLIEEGTYVVVRAGQRVGEERFRLWLADGAYRIESVLEQGGRTVTAVFVLDRGWDPLYYAEKGATPVTLRIVGGRPRLATGSGLFQREVEFPVLPPFAFLGVSSVAPWFAVYRQLQARPPGAEVTAVLPGERQVLPAVGGARRAVELVVGERLLPAEVLPVTLGDREVLLYGQGDLLLGAMAAGGEWVVYLKESLPEGLQPSL